MEEMQHAQLDTLMVVETLAEEMSQVEIEEAIEGYLAIGDFLDKGLKQQTQFDLDAFMAARPGASLTGVEQGEFLVMQHQANRWTYLGSGMTHPNFLRTLWSN